MSDAQSRASARRQQQQHLLAQLRAQGITDERVLSAIQRVPRDLFVATSQRQWAWRNRPLPLVEKQTISQPYIVAAMTEQLRLRGGEKVLEVGTGSGYQAAILAQLGASVHSVEIRPTLHALGRKQLDDAGFQRVKTRLADGYCGWPELAPFDAIIVTAAPEILPAKLVEQLRAGGVMIVPVGGRKQRLLRIDRTDCGHTQQDLMGVLFVPMVGAS